MAEQRTLSQRAANEQYRQGQLVSRAGTGVELIGAGIVGYEAARYVGLVDWVMKIGLPFLGKYASFLIPGALGLLTFIAGEFIASRGRRSMTAAAAALQPQAAHA